jgi:hypothetical protein
VSKKAYIGPSEAQGNAERLAARSSTFADDHARSWQVRWNRPTHEREDLRSQVRQLLKAYREEVPTRVHVHQVDGGGAPDYSPEMKQYLFGHPAAVDMHDERALDNAALPYLTPFRRCLWSMGRSTDETNRRRATIVGRITVGGLGPKEAAIESLAAGDECYAGIVAADAVRVFMRNLADMRLDLRPVDSEAPAA